MRRLGVAVLAALAAFGGGTFVTASPAGADPAATQVGGGASPISHQTIVGGPGGTKVTTTDPIVVILPNQGSPGLSKHAVGAVVGGIDVGIVRARTKGNLDGTPFAQSSAEVAGITIPGVDVQAIGTDCIWDLSGISAHTSLVRVNGTRVETVAPNTERELPNGLGFYILNEQYHDTFFDGHELIGVIGLDLYLNTNPNRTERFIFAESSCDPLKLPSLTGTQFFGD
jgi:hypothetical protein